MRKRFIVKQFLGLSVAFATLNSCKQKAAVAYHDVGKIEVDSALKALLAPTNQQVMASAKTTTATYGPKIFMTELQGVVAYDTRGEQSIASRVSGRIEKLYVRYNYQAVKKGDLVMEIYAPDLAAAQQELIYLSQNTSDGVMLEKAKQRLLLLGVPAKTVAQILRTKQVLYKIPVYSTADGFVVEQSGVGQGADFAVSAAQTSTSSGSMAGMEESAAMPEAELSAVQQTPIRLTVGQYVNAGQRLFTIYKAENAIANFAIKPAMAKFIQKDAELIMYNPNSKAETFKLAKVGLIQPMVKAGEPFNLLRVYLGKSKLKVGEVLMAKLPIAVGKSYWLPSTAVISNGNEFSVFKQEGNAFISKNVNVGLQIDGLVQIHTEIANWVVATDAAYLVDSESFIKSK